MGEQNPVGGGCPVDRLVFCQSSGIPPDLGAGPICLADTEMGGGGAHLGLGSGDWGSSAGASVTHLLFAWCELYLCLLDCWSLVVVLLAGR